MLGCGIGLESGYLANKGWIVDAIDVLPHCENYIWTHVDPEHKPNLKFMIGDITNPNILSQLRPQYDIIIALASLPYLSTRDLLLEAIRTIYNRLKPGGLFIASFLGSNHEWNGTHNIIFLSLEEITGMLSSFQIQKIDTIRKLDDGGNGLANIEIHYISSLKPN